MPIVFSVISALFYLGALAFPFTRTEFSPELGEIVPVPELQERLRSWLAQRLGVPEGENYLLQIVRHLLHGGVLDKFVGLAVVAFSVIFPVAKILAAGLVAMDRGRLLSPKWRDRLVHLVEGVGRLSMADVFIAAFVVVWFKASAIHFSITPRLGLYFYGSAALTSFFAVAVGKRPYPPASG